MSWFAWAVGKVLRPRQITMEEIRNGAHIQWGWRSTEIRDDDGKVIAHTPGASKPGHVGPFPVEDEDPVEDEGNAPVYNGDWLE